MRGLRLCLLLFLLLGAPPVSHGGTVYSYVDDDGTVIMTDRLTQVPPRFRDKVTVLEEGEVPAPSTSRSANWGEGTGWSQRFWNALPEEIVPGLTQYQSVLLIGGSVIATVVFAAMMLTRNPALQFALKWALIFVAGGTFYGIYFAELGADLTPKGEKPITDPRTVVDRVRVKVKEIEARQEERTRQIERLERLDSLDELNRP